MVGGRAWRIWRRALLSMASGNHRRKKINKMVKFEVDSRGAKISFDKSVEGICIRAEAALERSIHGSFTYYTLAGHCYVSFV